MGMAPRSVSWLSARRLRLLGALLLLSCVLLGSILLATFAVSARPKARDPSRAASLFGMDLWFTRGPFDLMVDKHFPRSDTFKLFAHDRSVLVSGEDVTGPDVSVAKKTVELLLGPDFSVRCFYSPDPNAADGNVRVREIELAIKDACYIDLNGDGMFDERFTNVGPASVLHCEVWYQGKWCRVVVGDGLGRYRRHLVGAGFVRFDMKIGAWVADETPPKKPGPVQSGDRATK